MADRRGDVTLLLCKLKQGDRDAAHQLIPLVYQELRKIAGAYMRDERPDHTLQPTALVNEAYLRLADQTRVDWRDRAHFFGVAARMMRRVLVDHAREHLAGKRGGGQAKLALEGLGIEVGPPKVEEVLLVDQALEKLKEFDPRQEQIVEMHYFGGMSVEETAEALGISARTVDREWAMARAWLRRELSRRAAS